MSLKLLCDENLPGKVLLWLAETGCDVKRVVPSTPDFEIGELAKLERRAIVTFDSDFANIISFPPQEFFGIIRLRIDPPFFSIVINSLERIFKVFNSMESLKGKLIIGESWTFRIWDKLPGEDF